MGPPTMQSKEVYLLPLNDEGAPQVGDQNFISLQFPTSDPIWIRFCIEGTSSICNHGSLWVNIPEEGDEFQREKFRQFKYGTPVIRKRLGDR
jgi:glycogen debranching enzyme